MGLPHKTIPLPYCATASTAAEPASYYDKLWIGVGAGLGAAVILIVLFLLALCVPFCVNYRQKKKMFNSVAKVSDYCVSFSKLQI